MGLLSLIRLEGAETLLQGGLGEGAVEGAGLSLLSPREREVFEYLAAGHTNREIADRISVGVKSVETYRARVFEKLGIKTRAELVRYAMATGVIRDSE